MLRGFFLCSGTLRECWNFFSFIFQFGCLRYVCVVRSGYRNIYILFKIRKLLWNRFETHWQNLIGDRTATTQNTHNQIKWLKLHLPTELKLSSRREKEFQTMSISKFKKTVGFNSALCWERVVFSRALEFPSLLVHAVGVCQFLHAHESTLIVRQGGG